jgi:hypothetical protein
MSETLAIVPLTEAASRLHRVLGFQPRALTPDAIAQGLQEPAWAEIPGWEHRDDLDIAGAIGLLDGPIPGEVLIVTEASFITAHGAFVVPGAGVRALVASHLLNYGECFFNGDVVAVALDSKEVWLFHHEGAYLHAKIE